MPLVQSAGVTVKVPSLQITAVMALIAGLGLTVTVIVNGVPVQLPDLGVTEYVAVSGPLVLLVSVPLMLAAFVPAEPPEIPASTVGADHVKVVPEGMIPSVPSTGLTVKLLPLQMAGVKLFTAGIGLTVTVTVKSFPVHGPSGDTGVTVYVAVPALLPVFISVPVILAPDPPSAGGVMVPVIDGTPQL